MSQSPVQKKKQRRKNYKRKRYGGAQGCKERLRLKFNEVLQTCKEIKETEVVLKEKEDRLRKENILLRRFLYCKYNHNVG